MTHKPFTSMYVCHTAIIIYPARTCQAPITNNCRTCFLCLCHKQSPCVLSIGPSKATSAPLRHMPLMIDRARFLSWLTVSSQSVCLLGNTYSDNSRKCHFRKCYRVRVNGKVLQEKLKNLVCNSILENKIKEKQKRVAIGG